MWNKQVLLRDHADRNRSVGALLSAKIIFHKLAREMQRQRIDCPRAFKIPHERNVDLVIARGRYQTQNQCREDEYPQLSPVHKSLDP
jgi:hypothetical protein